MPYDNIFLFHLVPPFLSSFLIICLNLLLFLIVSGNPKQGLMVYSLFTYLFIEWHFYCKNIFLPEAKEKCTPAPHRQTPLPCSTLMMRYIHSRESKTTPIYCKISSPGTLVPGLFFFFYPHHSLSEAWSGSPGPDKSEMQPSIRQNSLPTEHKFFHSRRGNAVSQEMLRSWRPPCSLQSLLACVCTCNLSSRFLESLGMGIKEHIRDSSPALWGQPPSPMLLPASHHVLWGCSQLPSFNSEDSCKTQLRCLFLLGTCQSPGSPAVIYLWWLFRQEALQRQWMGKVVL